MTSELFRTLAILIGAIFGVLLTIIGTLILFWLKDTRETVKNHWTQITILIAKVGRIEGWTKALLKANGIGDGNGEL